MASHAVNVRRPPPRALRKCPLRRRGPRGAGKCRAATHTPDVCFAANVEYEHVEGHATRFEVVTRDHAGLLRALAWTVNGMGYAVVDGEIDTKRVTCEESHVCLPTEADALEAKVSWTLRTKRGEALTDDAADEHASRVEDIIHFCAPSLSATGQSIDCDDVAIDDDGAPLVSYSHGAIDVINRPGGEATELVITAAHRASREPGCLLEVASAVHASGLRVLNARIKTVDGCDTPTGCNRSLHFGVLTSRGERLEYDRMVSVVFALQLSMARLLSLQSPVDGCGAFCADQLDVPGLNTHSGGQ